MEYGGTVHGSRVDLDEPIPVPDGTRVRVEVTPESEPRRGSPEAVLKLAGIFTDEEADEIFKVTQEFRRVDESLWRDDP